MAILWQPILVNSVSALPWQPMPLTAGAPVLLGSFATLRYVRSRVLPPGRACWVLLPLRQASPAPVAVNGAPLALGMRVLADRDAISTDGVLRFFSTEEPARIEPFPGLAGGKPGVCARCRTPVAVGQPAVRCPCGAWCHQSDALPCWAYEGTTTCPLCDQPNTLDAFRWTPESDGF